MLAILLVRSLLLVYCGFGATQVKQDGGKIIPSWYQVSINSELNSRWLFLVEYVNLWSFMISEAKKRITPIEA